MRVTAKGLENRKDILTIFSIAIVRGIPWQRYTLRAFHK